MPSNNLSQIGKILCWHINQFGRLELVKMQQNNKLPKFTVGFEAICKRLVKKPKQQE